MVDNFPTSQNEIILGPKDFTMTKKYSPKWKKKQLSRKRRVEFLLLNDFTIHMMDIFNRVRCKDSPLDFTFVGCSLIATIPVIYVWEEWYNNWLLSVIRQFAIMWLRMFGMSFKVAICDFSFET